MKKPIAVITRHKTTFDSFLSIVSIIDRTKFKRVSDLRNIQGCEFSGSIRLYDAILCSHDVFEAVEQRIR